jgi:hypothetical protein
MNSTRPAIIISNPDYESNGCKVKLLRVVLTEHESKFDFGYQTSAYYISGGWITISPKTFIRESGSKEKIKLQKATNIPFGPEKHYFKSTIDWSYFSLYFPPLPQEISEIDLIEAEPGTKDDFNFFNIKLKDHQKSALIFR